MGYGHILKCRCCDYKINVWLEFGFLYDKLCKEILENMKKGEFGFRFKNDALSIEHPAVSATRELFICDNCKELKNALLIELCKAKDPKGKKHSLKKELGAEYYLLPGDIGKSYVSVRQKKVFCPECRKKMRLVEKKEKLFCPKCGEELYECEEFLWD